MEEMLMHHLFEYGVHTFLLAKLLGGVAISWGVNYKRHEIGLKLLLKLQHDRWRRREDRSLDMIVGSWIHLKIDH
jgi:hypothetical protein